MLGTLGKKNSMELRKVLSVSKWLNNNIMYMKKKKVYIIYNVITPGFPLNGCRQPHWNSSFLYTLSALVDVL